jgi:glutamate--cysteine ligase
MARDTTDDTLVTSIDDLTAHIAAGEKPESAFRLGTEHEKFVFFTKDNSPVPYEGEAGIKAILEIMRDRLGWDAIIDKGNIIGLGSPTGMGAISLEPGGQFELSGAPLATLHETAAETRGHLDLMRDIADPMGIGFLGLGGSPKWSWSETPKMPKSRYDIMSRYMPKVGTRGLDMMYRTCTIQVNLDFSSEDDMRRKMQVGLKLQSLATALFAASPFTEGKPNGFKSWRGDIWRDTDNARAGLLPFAFSDGFGYRDYVEWALDTPMYFVVRDGAYRDCTHVTFRQFMAGALKGELADWQPNMGDWTNHLSTLFPDVRLKRFLEMRGADCGPESQINALPAFWVGLLYDAGALEDAVQLTRDWSFEAVQAARDAVPEQGLDTMLGARRLGDIARDALAISRKGLKARNLRNDAGADETIYLEPLEEIVAGKPTLADELLARFNGAWNGSVEPVFSEYRY